MFTTSLNQNQILTNVQQRLVALRDALDAVQHLEGWAAGVAAADLQTLGFSAADAATLLSAVSDAAALASVYTTGQPPASYPQATSSYVYANSQRQVIGPQ